MKKTIVNIAVVGLSFFCLLAFAQLKSSQSLIEQCSTSAACNAENSFEHVIINEVVYENPVVDTQQQKLEETIPHFHQQLSTFVPF